ncbi:MAG: DUF1871 family protein [Bacillota bacterium]|nr:DUF1871 family protein [Bacillota bacterium]
MELQINHQLVDALNEWDPFKLGYGNYETEIADVIQAVHEWDEILGLAKKIQVIYECSFEDFIPLDKCMEIANKLLMIKLTSSCER